MTQKIDDAAAAEMIRKCARQGPEEGHMKADEILCEILASYGYTETVEAFNALCKWYC